MTCSLLTASCIQSGRGGARNWKRLKELNVTAIVSISVESVKYRNDAESQGFRYMLIKAEDNGTSLKGVEESGPLLAAEYEQLCEKWHLAHAFTNEILALNSGYVTQYCAILIYYLLNDTKHNAFSSGVLVHCEAGCSRSPTVIISYLMRHRGMRLREAYDFTLRQRPSVSPNYNFLRQLTAYDAQLFPESPDGSFIGHWLKVAYGFEDWTEEELESVMVKHHYLFEPSLEDILDQCDRLDGNNRK